MKKGNIVLLFLLIALLAGVIFVIFRREQEIAPQPAPVAVAATSTPMPTATPESTSTPAPTAEPVATAEPSPTPLPTIVPTPVRITSGEFRSDTGTWLNLVVKWEVKDGTSLAVDVYTESYDLETYQRVDDLVIAVNDRTYKVSTGPIHLTAPTKTLNPLGSVTAEVSPGETVRIAAAWNFNGSYGSPSGGSIDLSTITAEETVQLP